MATQHKYQFEVKMTCTGCSGAVERVLRKAQEGSQGVESFNVDLTAQTVDVTGTISYDTLLGIIRKTQKEVISGKTIE